jgi:hypothetical protein
MSQNSVQETILKKAQKYLNDHQFHDAFRLLETRSVSSTALGKALKARCLVRFRRRDECASLACEAAKQAMGSTNTFIDSETILSACAALRQIGDDEQCIQIFETASSAAATKAAVPGSPASAHFAAISITRGLALALLRIGDIKKLQMVSMRLSKITSAAANAASIALSAKAEFEGLSEKDIKSQGRNETQNRIVAKGSEYMIWAVLALNCCANDGSIIDAKKSAPISITGGGRGYGSRMVFEESVVRTLLLGETMLTRALDVLEPNERSSEALGLLVHLLVRAGKPAHAYTVLVGKYAFLRDADVSHLLSEDCGASLQKKHQTDNSNVSIITSESLVVTAGVPNVSAAHPPTISTKTSNKGSKSKKGTDKIVPTSSSDMVSQTSLQKDDLDPFQELVTIRAPRVEPIERTPDDWVNDCADGREGRGVSPSPMVLVEFLRLVAYTLSISAALEEKNKEIRSEIVTSSEKTPQSHTVLGISPESCGGFPVGSWEAARHAYAILLTDSRIEEMHDDWAIHCGLASTYVRISAQSISQSLQSSDTNGINDILIRLAPLIKSESFLDVSGEKYVDKRFESFLASDDTVVFQAQYRGRALACVLHQAIRLEILHRVIRLLRISSIESETENTQKFQAVFDKGCIAYTQIISRYITSIASKPCCFLDIRQFLGPFLTSLQRDEVSPPSQDIKSMDQITLKKYIRAFMSDSDDVGIGIISVPYVPVGAAGHSSDQSPKFSLFRFSFSVPPSLVQDIIHPLLSTLCEKTRPDIKFREELCKLVSSARTRALERTTSIAAPKLYDPKNFEETDPHGVKAALAPAAELVLLPTDEAQLHTSKVRIRTYATCLQIQRFLGVLCLKVSSSNHNSIEVFEKNEKNIKTNISEIVEAWRCSIPLGWATVSGQHEGLEGDDLLLLAAHLLWDIAFCHTRLSIHTRNNITSTTEHEYKARSALFESAMLLQCASSTSPYNGQFNLALVKVNSWIAAGAQILTEFRKLRIKHISTDTLSHLVVPHIIRVSWHDAVREVCHELCEFHRTSSIDTGDYAAVALSSGNLSSVIDIIRMRERLANSATLALGRARHAGNALVTFVKNLNEASIFLRRCSHTGELPDFYVGDLKKSETLLSFRDNDERELMNCWDSPVTNSASESDFLGLETLQIGTVLDLLDPSHLSAEKMNSILTSSFKTSKTEIKFDQVVDEFTNVSVSGGGSSYQFRLIRRCLRDNFLSCRSLIIDILARVTSGYLNGKFDDLKIAEESLDNLKSIFTRCGYSSLKGENCIDESEETRRFVYGDVFNTLIPIIDTGISFERDSVKQSCIKILFYALSSSVIVARWCEARWLSEDSEDSCSIYIANLKTIMSEIDKLAGHDGLLSKRVYMPMPPSISSSSCISPTEGPLYASFFPEVSFLSQQTLGPVCIALSVSSKVIGVGGANLKPQYRKRAADATQDAFLSIHSSLSCLLRTIREAKNLIDMKDEKSITLVTSGYSSANSSSELAKSFSLDFSIYMDDISTILNSSVSSSSNRGIKKSHGTAISTTFEPDSNQGDSFVRSLESNLISSFDKSSKNAIQAIGGAYTFALDSLNNELVERLTWFKT